MYKVIKSTIICDDETYNVYGITYSNIISIKNIFLKREQAQCAVDKFNKLKLSPIHLADVIEDMIQI